MMSILIGAQELHKNSGSHIDASHSRQPLVKGERLVRHEVNAVIVIDVLGMCIGQRKKYKRSQFLWQEGHNTAAVPQGSSTTRQQEGHNKEAAAQGSSSTRQQHHKAREQHQKAGDQHHNSRGTRDTTGKGGGSTRRQRSSSTRQWHLKAVAQHRQQEQHSERSHHLGQDRLKAAK